MKKLLLSLTLSASLLLSPALAAEAVTFTDVARRRLVCPLCGGLRRGRTDEGRRRRPV